MAYRLNPDQTLMPNQSLQSSNGRSLLIMQGDGNFVLYEAHRGQQIPVWASNTPGQNGARVIMQGDGNLVVYTSGNQPIWASNTYGKPGAYLVMQDDGN